MSPRELLEHLRARGVEVRAVGGDLLLVPKSRLTTALMEAAARMKPELVGLLRGGAATRAAEPGRAFREAIRLVAHVVSAGSTFEIMPGDDRAHLIWFAPQGVPPDTMAAVARLEHEIVEVLRSTDVRLPDRLAERTR